MLMFYNLTKIREMLSFRTKLIAYIREDIYVTEGVAFYTIVYLSRLFSMFLLFSSLVFSLLLYLCYKSLVLTRNSMKNKDVQVVYLYYCEAPFTSSDTKFYGLL